MLDDIFRISREFLKIFQRPYERYFLTRHPFESRFSIVTGQRGVGKTTVMIQKIMSMVQNDIFTQNALYVPVDHFMVGGKSLYAIAEAFYNLGGEIICFDEIHKHADWSGELKSIYDSMPNLTLMASGSSALEIQKGRHDLSRRAVVYSMSGLSFREYLGLAAGIRIEPFIFEEVIENHERIAGGIITLLTKTGTGLGALEKPEKIYLNNPNQVYAISGGGRANMGTIRETFFINALSPICKLSAPKKGDFCVDDKYTFEIGGKNKGFQQIRNMANSFLALDEMEMGVGNKIPLWLFGFLY